MSKSIIDPPTNVPSLERRSEVGKILLRGETLAITKKWIHESDVKIHKEFSTENKTISVPVTREELVIEKIDRTGKEPYPVSTLRIPLCEEQVEVIKKPVILEHVSIYKRQLQETEHVEATLKKERLYVDIDGQCIVVDEDAHKTD